MPKVEVTKPASHGYTMDITLDDGTRLHVRAFSFLHSDLPVPAEYPKPMDSQGLRDALNLAIAAVDDCGDKVLSDATIPTSVITDVASECPRCHYTVVTDDNVYCCPSCGEETCPDCAGRCGCKIDSDED